eukprot:3649428-Prymnesium_polylepis.2
MRRSPREAASSRQGKGCMVCRRGSPCNFQRRNCGTGRPRHFGLVQSRFCSRNCCQTVAHDHHDTKPNLATGQFPRHRAVA